MSLPANTNLIPVHAFDSQLTMSSVEIAELTGKRHDNVMLDIRKMLKELDILAPEFSGARIVRGKESEIFNLPRRECTILVSGYNVKMRAAIIDRWQELEQDKIPKSYPEALRLAAEQAERAIQLEGKVQEMTPKVKALEKISDAEGLKTLTDTAKTLQMKRKDLILWMLGNGWLYRRGEKSALYAYDVKRHQDLLRVKDHVFTGSDGIDRVTSQVYVTAKGMTKLAQAFSKG